MCRPLRTFPFAAASAAAASYNRHVQMRQCLESPPVAITCRQGGDPGPAMGVKRKRDVGDAEPEDDRYIKEIIDPG